MRRRNTELTNDTAVNFYSEQNVRHYIRETDPAALPRVGISVQEDFEDEEYENSYKYCPNCQGLLDKTEAPRVKIWYCKSCGTVVNDFNYDKPLVTNKQSEIKLAFGQRGRYPSYEQGDEEGPYWRSINPEQVMEEGTGAFETVWSDKTGRVKSIRIRAGHSISEYDILKENREVIY